MTNEECTLCYGKGVYATLVHIDEHGNEEVVFTFCTDCEHGKTFYETEKGFHFKLVEAMVINVMPETMFELDEDAWVHNMRTSIHEIKFSAPLDFIKQHLTKVGEDDEQTSILSSGNTNSPVGDGTGDTS